jgi:anti-sigma factor RsiW
MNCQEFWNTMPELAGQHQHLERHLEQCAACAARLRSQRALKAGLRAVAGQMRQVGAPARVESRLRAAFRAHKGSPAYAPVRPHSPIVTWATAAAAVIGLAMFLVRQPAQMATDGETDGGTAVASSGFIALPNAAEIGPNEDANMVRVEVPRSAMIALGFPVNPEQAGQPVQADVMLGADGLARAVRFLD